MDVKFVCSKSDKMIAGVCGGMAQYWNVDVTRLRIGFVIIAIIGWFIPVLIYFILAILMQE